MPGTSHPSSLVPGAPGAHLRWAVVVTSYFLSLLYVLLTARLWVHAVEPSRVAFCALPAGRLSVRAAVPSCVALRMVARSPSPSPSVPWTPQLQVPVTAGLWLAMEAVLW